MKMQNKLEKYFNILKSEPLRFIRLMISRILLKTGLSKLFIIELGDIKLKFFPTRFSADLWYPKKNIYEDYNLPFLKSGDTVIDVGANIGFTALLFKRFLGDEGKVYAFEPNPVIYKYLQENIALNNLHNIYLFNYAVGAKKDKTHLYDGKEKDAFNYITSNVNNSFVVDMDCLDNLLEKNINEVVQLLKVDTEGYEKFVFLGAKKILSKTNFIIFEAIQDNCQRFNYNLKEVVELLENINFSIYCYNTETNNFEKINIDNYLNNRSIYLYDLFATKNPSLLKDVKWL